VKPLERTMQLSQQPPKLSCLTRDQPRFTKKPNVPKIKKTRQQQADRHRLRYARDLEQQQQEDTNHPMRPGSRTDPTSEQS